jgi:branched-chain amino acid transport system substrate-binding protein
VKRRSLVLLCSISLVAILATLSIVGCPAPAPPAEAKTLQIGGLMSLTGGFSGAHDIPDWNEAKIAAELINEKGGISVNGQKYLVELVGEDCKSTMEGVTAAANRLVFDKGIKFIIGPCAFFSAGAGPVTDPNQVIRVITWHCNTPGEMDASTPYAFLGCPASISDAIAAAKYLKKAYPTVEKVALITPDDGAVPYLIPKVEDILQSEGISVAGDVIPYSNELIDMSPIAAKVNAIGDADAVFQANGLAPHIGGIVKGLRDLGNYKPYAVSTGVPLGQVMSVAGVDACKDLFVTNVAADDPNLPSLAKEICQKTMAQYGSDWSFFMTAASCLWCLKGAIEAAQSLDPTVVKEKWETMNTIDTIYGTGRMGGEETYGIRHAVSLPTPIIVVKDGKVTAVDWIDIGVIP